MDKNETKFQFFNWNFSITADCTQCTSQFLLEKAKQNKQKKIVPTQEAHRIIPISFPYTVDATFPSGKLETKFSLPRTAKLNPVDQ